jgi:dephospho-CoA kinase
MKIAIIGEQCSGKTTAAKFIAEMFPTHYIHKFADPIYCSLSCLGKEKKRGYMHDFSDVAKKHFGKHIFAESFERSVTNRDRFCRNKDMAIICDDVRYLYELELVRKLGFKVMSIDTSTSIRKERADKLGLDFIENHNSEVEIQDLIWHADSVLLDRGEVTLYFLKEHCQQTIKNWQKEM